MSNKGILGVVNRHHKQPFDLYIGRGTKWGNPFSTKPYPGVLAIASSREDAIQMYELWIQTQQQLMEDLKELDGKVLGCSCYPLPCHGNVLMKLRQQQIANTNNQI